MAAHPDVLIIGGGIIGLTAAYELANAGTSVTILDRGEPGREASWAGAGIIPPGNVARAQSPLDRLRAFGAEHFPAFSQHLKEITGIDSGYRINGGIEQLDDPDIVELWEAEKIPFEKIDKDRYFLPGMAQIRNPWYIKAMLEACRLRGVNFQRADAEQFEIRQNRIDGLRLHNDDILRAGKYLVAAGAWSQPLLKSLNVSLVVFPVRGQIVQYRSMPEVLKHTLIVGKRYLVPRGDGYILAGSTEEPEAGFNKFTTGLAISELRAFAEELVPTLKDAAIEKAWAGLRPAILGATPVISPVPEFANAFVATGHFRSGIQLSPGTATLLADLVLNRKSQFDAAAFHLQSPRQSGGKAAFRS